MTKNPKTKTQQDQNDKKANFHFIRSPSGVSNGMNLNIGSSSSHRFTPTSELLKNYKGSLIEP